jgi:hypothetical protein
MRLLTCCTRCERYRITMRSTTRATLGCFRTSCSHDVLSREYATAIEDEHTTVLNRRPPCTSPNSPMVDPWLMTSDTSVPARFASSFPRTRTFMLSLLSPCFQISWFSVNSSRLHNDRIFETACFTSLSEIGDEAARFSKYRVASILSSSSVRSESECSSGCS